MSESSTLPYSTHILFFPFQWRVSDSHSGESTRKQFQHVADSVVQSPSHWTKVLHSKKRSTQDYSQFNYLHDSAHAAVFEGTQKFPSVYNFEYFDTKSFVLKVRKSKAPVAIQSIQALQCEENGIDLLQFTLLFKSARLNIYETGVGVLSLFIENIQHRSKEETLAISDMIRRLYPPHLNPYSGVERLKNSYLLPHSVQLGDWPLEDWSIYPGKIETGSTQQTPSEPLDLSKIPDRYVPKYIMQLLGTRFVTNSLQLTAESIEIQQALDDRMFLMCLLVDPEAVKPLELEEQVYLKNPFWYSFVFVDSESPTIANKTMMSALLQEATYARWSEDGTLYGACRYAFSALTGKGGLVAPPFTGNYRRLVELCLVQRASVLKFREEASIIAVHIAEGTEDKRALAKRIRTLYGDYIRFTNRFHFLEVTPVEQGLEIYDLLRKQMRVQEQADSLKTSIEDLHTYATMLHEEQRNNALTFLTVLGATFVIPSFFLSYFGLFEGWRKPLEGHGMALAVVFAAGGGLAAFLHYYEWLQKGGWKRALALIFILIYLLVLFQLPRLLAWGWIS